MRAIDARPVGAVPIESFRTLFDPAAYAALEELARHAQAVFSGRVLWSVNSTPRGGGVAELLESLLAYARGVGVDGRWMVAHGGPDFFRVTKRLHNRLHGAEGDGGPLGPREHAVYEDTLAQAGRELSRIVRARDIVLLHDPQTAGLVPALRATGAKVVWRAHVGLDQPNSQAREAWSFLRPYVRDAHAFVFSRAAHVWEDLPADRVTVIPPSIDAFSPKNQELGSHRVLAILNAAGLVGDGDHGDATFRRMDGTPGRVDRRARMVEERRLRPRDPVVLQVSRWDALKDPVGVMRAFATHVAPRAAGDLLLAGPDVNAVSDDPEGSAVFADTEAARDALEPGVRARVHLASLPMDDTQENAAIVNALQRHATVVVQKSLAEGFGLTVAEAMWKGRPVVASRIGGIQDQIVDGQSGVLVPPDDPQAFGAAVARLLAAPDEAHRLGEAARDHVRQHFLGPRQLAQYFELFERLIASREAPPQPLEGTG